MLGEVRVFQNQWDAAQTEILAARKQARALTEVDQYRVEAFLARVFGMPFEERVQWQKLIGLQPYKREYLYELAESYFHTADVDEAISKYQDALSLDNKYELAYNHLAYCYSWRGDHAQATSPPASATSNSIRRPTPTTASETRTCRGATTPRPRR